jgi:hypothetical protein
VCDLSRDPERRASVQGDCFDGSGVTSPSLPRFKVSPGFLGNEGKFMIMRIIRLLISTLKE